MNLRQKRWKIHYAWVICGASTLMLFIAMGLNSNVFSVYQPYILSLYRFTNTQNSLLITVRCLFSIFGMMTVDRACHRLTLRGTVAAGILLQIVSRVIFGASFVGSERVSRKEEAALKSREILRRRIGKTIFSEKDHAVPGGFRLGICIAESFCVII